VPDTGLIVVVFGWIWGVRRIRVSGNRVQVVITIVVPCTTVVVYQQVPVGTSTISSCVWFGYHLCHH